MNKKFANKDDERKSTEGTKNFKKTVKRIGSHLWQYKIGVAFTVIFSIIGSVFAVVGPMIMGRAVTTMVNGVSVGVMDFNRLAMLCLILVGLYLVSALFSYLQSFVIAGVTQKMIYNYRKDISQKINKIPLNYFDTQTHGEVLSKVTNDVSTLSTGLREGLAQAISSIITMVGIVIMMITISVTMTVVTFGTVIVSMLCIRLIVKYSQKYYKIQQAYLGKINGEVEETFGGHNIIRAFNNENQSIAKFSEYNEQLYNSAWKAQFFGGIMMPIIRAVGNLGYVAITIAGTLLVTRQMIQIGDILAFIQYFRQFNTPVAQIGQMTSVLQSTAAAAERIFEFLDEEEEPLNIENDHTIKDIKGVVEFKNVKFGYDPSKIIINNFSAKIPQGQKVAIVGPTGAGKTTIVKLLMRFYDINEGKIFIDGIDVKSFNRDELRELFGMVLQDTWLFNGTIKDNLKYGNLNATDEQVKKASKESYAHEFIKKLPDGYNMVINEEADNISQGQKQLLTIARAILANPTILVLDEATSSVDTRTEVLIQKAMETLMEGRTSFIIAHRLSTIKNAHTILVMENGSIVEQGSHKELIEAKGVFYKLYQSQFEVQEIV